MCSGVARGGLTSLTPCARNWPQTAWPRYTLALRHDSVKCQHSSPWANYRRCWLTLALYDLHPTFTTPWSQSKTYSRPIFLYYQDLSFVLIKKYNNRYIYARNTEFKINAQCTNQQLNTSQQLSPIISRFHTNILILFGPGRHYQHRRTTW